MGYGDYGALLPGASSYKNPRGLLDAAKAEGSKRASYLSQMDMFYAQLEESSRQFEKNYGLKERELDVQSKAEDWRKDFSYAQLEQQGELTREELSIRRQDRADRMSLGQGNLKLQGRGLDLQEESMNRESSVYNRWGPDIIRQALYGSGGRGGSLDQGAPEGTVYGSGGIVQNPQSYGTPSPADPMAGKRNYGFGWF